MPPEHWGREHYLPFTPNAIVDSLLRDSPLSTPEQTQFRALVDQIKRNISLAYHSHHEVLSDLYQRYDPDRDFSDRVLRGEGAGVEGEFPDAEWKLGSCGGLTDREASRELFSEIAASLGHANYRRLSPREIQNAIGVASHWACALQHAIQSPCFRG